MSAHSAAEVAIPDEIWVEILKFFDDSAGIMGRLAIVRVSRKFRRLADFFQWSSKIDVSAAKVAIQTDEIAAVALWRYEYPIFRIVDLSNHCGYRCRIAQHLSGRRDHHLFCRECVGIFKFGVKPTEVARVLEGRHVSPQVRARFRRFYRAARG
jgi:hypothetical protein